MIQLRSILKPADNSGAKRLMVMHIYVGSKRKWGNLGSEVLCVVKAAAPDGVVKKKERVRALVVRTKKAVRRKDGSYIRFDDNAVVLIDKQGLPKGTRVFGPVAREIKEKGFTKIASMAKELI